MNTIPLLTAAELEPRIRETGLSVSAFLRAADWNATSWYAWRKGKFSPPLDKYVATLKLLGIGEP